MPRSHKKGPKARAHAVRANSVQSVPASPITHAAEPLGKRSLSDSIAVQPEPALMRISVMRRLTRSMTEIGPVRWATLSVVSLVTVLVAGWLYVSFNFDRAMPAPLLALIRGDSDSKAGYFASAFLVLARDPADGADHVLVGLDFHTAKWADFGGQRDAGEIDPVYTACRELHEETAGVLPPVTSIEACMRHAAECTPAKVTYTVPSKHSSFYQYILAVPYASDLPAHWPPSQSFLHRLVHPHEKEKLQWVRRDEFETSVRACCAAAPQAIDGDNHSGSAEASVKRPACIVVEGLSMRRTFVWSVCRLLHEHPDALSLDAVPAHCYGGPDARADGDADAVPVHVEAVPVGAVPVSSGDRDRAQ